MDSTPTQKILPNTNKSKSSPKFLSWKDIWLISELTPLDLIHFSFTFSLAKQYCIVITFERYELFQACYTCLCAKRLGPDFLRKKQHPPFHLPPVNPAFQLYKHFDTWKAKQMLICFLFPLWLFLGWNWDLDVVDRGGWWCIWRTLNFLEGRGALKAPTDYFWTNGSSEMRNAVIDNSHRALFKKKFRSRTSHVRYISGQTSKQFLLFRLSILD